MERLRRSVALPNYMRLTIWVKKKRSPDIELIQTPPKPHTRVGETRISEQCRKRAVRICGKAEEWKPLKGLEADEVGVGVFLGRKRRRSLGIGGHGGLALH